MPLDIKIACRGAIALPLDELNEFQMELDPHYIDVIIARWEKYTGKKAVICGQT